MATVVLNLYTWNFPTITNRIRMSVFLQTDPQAFVASQIDAVSGHPERIWSFPGLPRENYGVVLDEIDVSDNVLRQLAFFDVVPSELESELCRDDEQIKVDTTPGLNGGATSAVFDGTTVSGGSLAVPLQGNLSPSNARFTLSGVPITGDTVQVDFDVDLNDIDGIQSFSVTSTVLAGWTLTDLITDLYNQMHALNVNTFAYASGGNNGVRTQGFSSASIIVTVTPIMAGVKPDYRGWEIVVSELTGRGIMVKTYLDYTWDSVTGIFTLLQPGDVFASGTWYNIHFNCQSNPAGGSVPTVFDFGIRIITNDTVLSADDFGKKLIVEPAAMLVTVTLPSIVLVPQGRRLMVEISNQSPCCVQIIPNGADTINFLNGNIYMLPNESLTIYRLRRSVSVSEWRVFECDGNFKTVGQLVPDDAAALAVWNKKILDGSIENADRYARIYNEIVLNLPIGQVVDFADWLTGNNKYYYSFTNGSNQFHFPDRRGIFERNVAGGFKPGDFVIDSFKSHSHLNGMADDTDDLFVYGESAVGMPGLASRTIVAEDTPKSFQGNTSGEGGAETAPAHYYINKYVLI